MSGCADRTPLFTARPNSTDDLIRFRAGSTTRDLEVRQSENRGPYGGGRTRWLDRPGCACATGSRGPWPAADYSAGRSAYPWPRLCLLVVSGVPGPEDDATCTSPGSETAPCLKLFRTGAVPESGRCRITDVWRPFEGTEVASAGQTATAHDRGPQLHHRAFTGWHPRRNLLASGKQAVRST